MNLSKIKKVLIIRLSSLGDVLLTTPVVRSLKKQFPNLVIDFLVREQYKDAIYNNPYIQSIIPVSRDYSVKNLRKTLSHNNYDLVIDLQNNLRSRRISRAIASQVLRFSKPALNKMLLVKFKINRFNKIISIPERYANSVPSLILDENGLEYFGDEEETATLKNEINYIGFCPGSRHKTKMWPEQYFIELGKKLTNSGSQIVLFGGKDDIEVCTLISNQIPNSINLANNNNLSKMAIDMRKCKAIICNDSGLMHFALAVNIPVIAIFGSTVKEFGFAPFRGKNIVLENNLLSCRPCSHIGLDKCPKKHFKCMLEIDPELVFNKTLEIIN